MNPELQLEPVPSKMENVLKKKKSLEILEKQRANKNLEKIQKKQLKKRTKTEKPFRFKKAETIVMQARKKERNAVRAKRVEDNPRRIKHEVASLNAQKQKSGSSDQNHLALVINIRKATGRTDQIQKILENFKLTKQYSAVLHPVSEKEIKLLKIVEPYVTWGFPDKQTIRDLLFKRGYARQDGTQQKIPLADNNLIEQQLGESTGMICVEDLVHELYTRGPNFSVVSDFLCPFNLQAPSGGFPNTRKSFFQGGDCGNRAEQIIDLVKRMI